MRKNNSIFKFYNFLFNVLIFLLLYLYLFNNTFISFLIKKVCVNKLLLFTLIYGIWGSSLYNLKITLLKKDLD